MPALATSLPRGRAFATRLGRWVQLGGTSIVMRRGIGKVQLASHKRGRVGELGKAASQGGPGWLCRRHSSRAAASPLFE